MRRFMGNLHKPVLSSVLRAVDRYISRAARGRDRGSQTPRANLLSLHISEQ